MTADACHGSDHGLHRCPHGVCLDPCCTSDPDPCGFCIDAAADAARADACRGSDDGVHRWRWQRGRWSGMPSYGCDGCGIAALPMGDDYAEDVAYLTADGRGVVVG